MKWIPSVSCIRPAEPSSGAELRENAARSLSLNEVLRPAVAHSYRSANTMHSTRALLLWTTVTGIAGVAAGSIATYTWMQSKTSKVAYHKAAHSLIYLTPACEAIQEGRAENALLVLEAAAEEAIRSPLYSLVARDLNVAEHDFRSSALKYGDYLAEHSRPLSLPPRGEEIQAAIKQLKERGPNPAMESNGE